jgi:hypothetical protein
MALETLKIIESGLEYYVLEKVPPQMGKSQYYVLEKVPPQMGKTRCFRRR